MVTLRALTTPLLDFLLPPVCLACNTPAPTTPLCPGCQSRLETLESHPACPHCARPLPEGASCGWCKSKGLPHLDHILRLATYDDPLRPLIHEMKYRHRWPLADHLATRLHSRSDVQSLLASADYLIPVPLHWRRHIARGYNQSHALAAKLSQLSKRPLLRSAIRVRNTPTQTGLPSRTARAENLRGAFSLRHPERIREKRLILIDDVLTTGATLLSLARTLAPAQPAAMSALVIAVADGNHRDFTTL